MVKGSRIRIPQWIEGRASFGSFVVRIDADAIVPDADPSEPCFEPNTIRMLEEVQRLADAGNVDALASFGEVFIRRSA